MSASQQPDAQGPAYFDPRVWVLKPSDQSGIRSVVEMFKRAAPKPKRARKPNKQSNVWAEKLAPRYAEIAQALRERPLHVPYSETALALGAARLTLRKVAKAQGISLAYVRLKAPKVVRVLVKAPRQARKPGKSNNVPKQPEVVLVEIPCICCRGLFMSRDRVRNRLCRTCKDNA